MSVPLDRVRVARRSLSSTWCSVLAGVSLIVVLHLAVAAVRHFLFDGRLRRFFDPPPPPPQAAADVRSPSSGVTADRAGDAAPVAATASERRNVDYERRGQHHPVPFSRHSAVQSPPSTVNQPSYSDRQHHHRQGFPTATAARAAHPIEQHRPAPISHEFAINIERMYYTDGIFESNV